MEVMNISMSAAQRTKDENRKLWAFSGLWKPGETWYVYYPLGNFDGVPDIIVNQKWGYSISDIKEFNLGRKFIPVESENGEKPDTNTLIHRFSKLCRCFNSGWYEQELARIDGNNNLSETQRRRKLKELDNEYEQKQPLISKLKMIITTECFMVKLDDKGVPILDTARLASQELSNGKIKALKRIIGMPMYGITADTKYLQVIYAFGNEAKKQEAGKVDPQGVAVTELIEQKYPNSYDKLLQSLEGLATTSEMIAKRNPDFDPVDPKELLRCMMLYTVDKTDYLESITSDENIEILKDNANTLKELGVNSLKNIDLNSLVEENNNTTKTSDNSSNENLENVSEIKAEESKADEIINSETIEKLASAI